MDNAVPALRLIVLAVIVLDLMTSVIAHAYGVTEVGPTGLIAILQSLLVVAAVTSAMWIRPWASVVLAFLSAVLVFVVGPTGSEFYVLAVTAVVVGATAPARYVVLVVAAQLAYAVGYYFLDGPGDDWVPMITVLAVALVGDGVGLIARQLIRARDRHQEQVEETERQNVQIRTAERARLAADLQRLVTRDLAEMELLAAGVDRATATAPDLRDTLARIRDLSTGLLAELRVLLQMLRRDLDTDEPAPLSSAAVRRHRWLDRLTAKDVRIAVSAVAGLLLVRAVFASGRSVSDPDLWVETLGLLAWGLAVWRPRLAVGVAGSALVVAVARAAPGVTDTLGVALLCLVGALRGPRRLWVVGLGLLAYGGLLAVIAPSDPIRRVVLVLATGLLAILAGTFARHLLGARAESRRRLARLMAERRRLPFVERSEVARELHDIVAHQLSVTSMVVMASSGSEDREELLDSLARVGRSTQAARRELKVLMSAMLGTGSELGESAPLVTPLACARAVERQLAEDGFHPVVDIDPAAEHLDSATQRTISRIMQEATTNIVRYAPAGSTAELSLVVGPFETTLSVSSPLASQTTTSDISLGWGLRGIRERVDLSQGSFTAGPDRGRWVVAVTLPDLTMLSLPAVVAR
ncbi:MAG TPA: histidine kinase [Propionibacteriaceae bacterium]